MSKRRRAREIALQMLYQQDLGGSSWSEIRKRFDMIDYALQAGNESVEGSAADDERALESVEAGAVAVPMADVETPATVSAAELRAARRYAENIASDALDHRDEIDEMIREQAENWRLERMAPVDRNILRLALSEFLYQPDVPQLVVVDEAIELAKKFGSEKSSSFVNGILDGLLKSKRFPGRLK